MDKLIFVISKNKKGPTGLKRTEAARESRMRLIGRLGVRRPLAPSSGRVRSVVGVCREAGVPLRHLPVCLDRDDLAVDDQDSAGKIIERDHEGRLALDREMLSARPGFP